jgi:hypothetical protein
MKHVFPSLLCCIFCLLLGYGNESTAQNNLLTSKKPLIVSIFNLGTQLPGSGFLGIFTKPIHPGISCGTEFRYNHHVKNQFFQTAKVAVSYHQYVQTGIQLYSEAGYRRAIWKGLQAEFRLGIGYLHAIAATEVFKSKEGVYDKKLNLGRPQFMATSALGLSYQVQKGQISPRFFLDYQFFLQMPFVKSYVPLAPNTVFHVGAAVPIFP